MGFAERANPNSWYNRKRRGERWLSPLRPFLMEEANEYNEHGTERGKRWPKNYLFYALLSSLLVAARDFRKYGIQGLKGITHGKVFPQNKQLRKQHSHLSASRGRR